MDVNPFYNKSNALFGADLQESEKRIAAWIAVGAATDFLFEDLTADVAL
jgi:hypothetical protein